MRTAQTQPCTSGLHLDVIHLLNLKLKERSCIEHEKRSKNGFVCKRAPGVDFLRQKNWQSLDFPSNVHSLIVYNKSVLYYLT